MPVSAVTKDPGPQRVSLPRRETAQAGFPDVLKNTAPETDREPGARNTGKSALVELGKISPETPTVSHILKNHPEYANECWDIIFSPLNSGKQFRKMQEGTVVALRTDSNELVWGRELSKPQNTAAAGPAEKSLRSIPQEKAADQSMVIGTISRDRPTVSHLFEAHADFDKSYWNIINAPVNSSKGYTTLIPGTQVVLDTKTMELSFKHSPAAKLNTTVAEIEIREEAPQYTAALNDTLADAVKPYIGTPYNKIDCYGLIVRGLQNQGIQYRGHGGIREKLEKLAVLNGLPKNAYFTGEGLVEKAGTKVFSKSMQNITNTRKQTDEIYSEITPYLREGFILSFSTPSRGHTGVVSREGNEWTYINSGLIDNRTTPARVSRGVGEEFLKAELNNWLVLAAGKKEPLRVTIGHLDNPQSKS